MSIFSWFSHCFVVVCSKLFQSLGIVRNLPASVLLKQFFIEIFFEYIFFNLLILRKQRKNTCYEDIEL